MKARAKNCWMRFKASIPYYVIMYVECMTRETWTVPNRKELDEKTIRFFSCLQKGRAGCESYCTYFGGYWTFRIIIVYFWIVKTDSDGKRKSSVVMRRMRAAQKLSLEISLLRFPTPCGERWSCLVSHTVLVVLFEGREMDLRKEF